MEQVALSVGRCDSECVEYSQSSYDRIQGSASYSFLQVHLEIIRRLTIQVLLLRNRILYISSIHLFLYVLSFFEFSKGLQVQVYCIIDPHLHWIGSQVKRINQVCAVSKFIEFVFKSFGSCFTRIILILFDSKKCMYFIQSFLKMHWHRIHNIELLRNGSPVYV